MPPASQVWVLIVLVAIVIGIGALAIYGVRRSRAMSRQYVADVEAGAEARRSPEANYVRRTFLRPMSARDIVLGILGAVLWIYVLNKLSHLF